MHRGLTLVTALTVAIAACAPMEKFVGAAKLRHDLEAEYPHTTIDVALVNGRQLELTLNGAAFRTLPVGQDEAKAKAVAHFAFEHYAPSATIDTIKVAFVHKWIHILVYTKTTSTSWSFATSDLR
jgi:hypothetical protein